MVSATNCGGYRLFLNDQDLFRCTWVDEMASDSASAVLSRTFKRACGVMSRRSVCETFLFADLAIRPPRRVKFRDDIRSTGVSFRPNRFLTAVENSGFRVYKRKVLETISP